jgi:hypothetical protein
MPDHLHVIVAASERDARLGNFSAALKRWMRKELDASWEWQAGCFDRLYGQMSPFMRNGFISREIQFAQTSSKIGKSGHIGWSLTTNNDCGEALAC